jgi:hypothetical protein
LKYEGEIEICKEEENYPDSRGANEKTITGFLGPNVLDTDTANSGASYGGGRKSFKSVPKTTPKPILKQKTKIYNLKLV